MSLACQCPLLPCHVCARCIGLYPSIHIGVHYVDGIRRRLSRQTSPLAGVVSSAATTSKTMSRTVPHVTPHRFAGRRAAKFMFTDCDRSHLLHMSNFGCRPSRSLGDRIETLRHMIRRFLYLSARAPQLIASQKTGRTACPHISHQRRPAL